MSQDLTFLLQILDSSLRINFLWDMGMHPFSEMFYFLEDCGYYLWFFFQKSKNETMHNICLSRKESQFFNANFKLLQNIFIKFTIRPII